MAISQYFSFFSEDQRRRRQNLEDSLTQPQANKVDFTKLATRFARIKTTLTAAFEAQNRAKAIDPNSKDATAYAKYNEAMQALKKLSIDTPFGELSSDITKFYGQVLTTMIPTIFVGKTPIFANETEAFKKGFVPNDYHFHKLSAAEAQELADVAQSKHENHQSTKAETRAPESSKLHL